MHHFADVAALQEPGQQMALAEQLVLPAKGSPSPARLAAAFKLMFAAVGRIGESAQLRQDPLGLDHSETRRCPANGKDGFVGQGPLTKQALQVDTGARQWYGRLMDAEQYLEAVRRLDPTDKEAFCELVRQGRLLTGATLRQVATDLRTAAGTVNRWENHLCAPPVVARGIIVKRLANQVRRSSAVRVPAGSGAYAG